MLNNSEQGWAGEVPPAFELQVWGCGQLFTAPWASCGGVLSCRVTWPSTSLRSRLEFWLAALLPLASCTVVLMMLRPKVTL